MPSKSIRGKWFPRAIWPFCGLAQTNCCMWTWTNGFHIVFPLQHPSKGDICFLEGKNQNILLFFSRSVKALKDKASKSPEVIHWFLTLRYLFFFLISGYPRVQNHRSTEVAQVGPLYISFCVCTCSSNSPVRNWFQNKLSRQNRSVWCWWNESKQWKRLERDWKIYNGSGKLYLEFTFLLCKSKKVTAFSDQSRKQFNKSISKRWGCFYQMNV